MADDPANEDEQVQDRPDSEDTEPEQAEVSSEDGSGLDAEPDNPDAIAALQELGARLQMDDNGRVWRIFLYEKHKDNVLQQIHGFPLLKEVWLLGSRCTTGAVQQLKESLPKSVSVYY